jgi:hypothetical protein
MGKKDLNQTAFSIVQQAIGEEAERVESAAAKMGRIGGLKGGKARQSLLTAEERVALAKKAAQTRWAKKKATEPAANETVAKPRPKIKVVV